MGCHSFFLTGHIGLSGFLYGVNPEELRKDNLQGEKAREARLFLITSPDIFKRY